MKHEYRKHEKQYYLPKAKPELIEIPEFQFITLSGQGNPNSENFQECIGALYSMAYAIKMNIKKLPSPPADYIDWTVYPLEGIWDLTEEGKKNYNGTLDKDQLVFKIMIRQPNFVSEEFFKEMLELTKKKKPNLLLDQIKFEMISDGKCIQMLHKGSFDEEPTSFKRMEEFALENSLTRLEKNHREIYLSDFRKVSEDKLKTVLRFWVK